MLTLTKKKLVGFLLLFSILCSSHNVQSQCTPIISPAGNVVVCGGTGSTKLILNNISNYNGLGWFVNGVLTASAIDGSLLITGPGTYSCYAVTRDLSDCFGTSAVTTVIFDVSKPTITNSGSAKISCLNNESVTLSTGTAAIYAWYNNGILISGAYSNSIVVSQAGSYTVGVLNLNSCSAVSNALVIGYSDPPLVVINSGLTNVLCGSGQTTTLSTNLGYTNYSWTLYSATHGPTILGQTSPSILVSSGGLYVVSAGNSNCTLAGGELITNSPNIYPTLLPYNGPNGPYGPLGPLNEICQGTILTTDPGADSYVWESCTNPQGPCTSVIVSTQSTFKPLLENGLSFRLTTIYNGCSSVGPWYNVNVINNFNPAVAISASSTTICQGTTVTFTGTPTNTGSLNLLTYQWKVNGTVVTSTGNRNIFSSNSLSNGDIVTCVLTSPVTCATSSGVAVSNPITMTVNPLITQPALSISASATSICSGANTTFTATPILVSGKPTYQWIQDGSLVGTNSPIYSTNSIVYPPNPNRQIYCILNSQCIANNLPFPGISNIIVMTVNPFPIVSFTGLNSSYCVGGASVTLTGSPSGGTFSGTGISGISFTPSTTGFETIVYSYTDVNGCTNTSSHSTVVKSLPIVSFTGLNSSYCVGVASVTLTGYPSGGTFSGTGISGSSFTPSTTGFESIVYSYTDVNGCTNTSSQSTTVNALPVVIFTGLNRSYCINAPSIILTTSPSGGVFSGTGMSGSSFTPSTTGFETIVYSYTDVNSCANTSSQSTTVNALPVVNFTGLNSSYCLNTPSIQLTGSPTGGTFSGTGMSVSSFTPSTAGFEAIVYSYTDVNSCTNTSSQSTTVNTLPVVSITGLSSSYCAGSASVTLTGSPFGGIFGGIGMSGSSFTPSIIGFEAITYNYTDINGCTNTSIQSTIVNPLPVVNFTGFTGSYCVNNPSVSLVGSPSGGRFSGSGVNGTNFSPTAAIPGGTTIVYTYTDANNCTNTSSQNITVHSLPVVSFTVLNSSYCVSAPPVALEGSPTGGIFSGPGVSGSSFAPSTITSSGLKAIVYTYTDVNNCTNSFTQNIAVNTLPVVSFTGLNSTYCMGASPLTLTGSPSGGSFSGSGISGSVFTLSKAGFKAIVYSYTDANSCTNTSSQNTTIYALPVVSFTRLASSYCLNAPSIQLTGSPSGGAFSGDYDINYNGLLAMATPGNYIITYTYKDAHGCLGSSSQNTSVGMCSVFIGAIPVSFCAGDSSVKIPYSLTGASTYSNSSYTVSLLYASGYPVQIGTLTNAGPSGMIPVTIPSNIPAGRNYRMQITTTSNALSTDNGTDLTISTNCGAYQFNGINSKILIPYNSANYAFGTGNMSIEAWVKINATSSGNEPIISQKASGVYVGTYMFMVSGGTSLTFQINNVNTVSTTFPSIYDGNCHHIAVTRSGTTISFYLDGVLHGTGTNSGNINNTSTNLKIGFDPYSNIYYNGIIDEVRLWNIARSVTDIANNKNVVLAGNTSGLKGYWQMNESSGQVVYDASLTQNNGSLGSDAVNIDSQDPLRVMDGGCYIPIVQSGLSFDGVDDRVTIPHNTSYDIGSGDFSIETWMNVRSSSLQYILSNRTSGTNGFIFATYQGNKLLLQLNGVPNYLSSVLPNLVDNNCHHIAVTRLGGTVTFYLDGKAYGTTTTTRSLNSSGSLYIGYDLFDNVSDNSSINEVIFWNIGLSAMQVSNSASALDPYNIVPNIIGYWRFDEPSGEALIDVSSTANNGYLGTNSTEFDNQDPLRITTICYSTDKIGYSPITNYNDDSSHYKASNVAIYPNPFSKETNILVTDQDDGEGILSILDITGKVVLEDHLTVNEIKTINFPLPAGVYIIQINRKNKVETYKILKAE